MFFSRTIAGITLGVLFAPTVAAMTSVDNPVLPRASHAPRNEMYHHRPTKRSLIKAEETRRKTLANQWRKAHHKLSELNKRLGITPGQAPNEATIETQEYLNTPQPKRQIRGIWRLRRHVPHTLFKEHPGPHAGQDDSVNIEVEGPKGGAGVPVRYRYDLPFIPMVPSNVVK